MIRELEGLTPEAEYDPPHKWFYTFKMVHKDFIFPEVTAKLYRSPMVWVLDSLHADIVANKPKQ